MNKCIERITRHEEELDYLLENIPKIRESIESYRECLKLMNKLNRYYGSDIWFSDVEKFDNKKIPRIKAGVLTEDSVYDVYMDLLDLSKEIKKVL